MERLTERFSNGQAAVYGCGSNCKHDYKYCDSYLENCPTISEIYEKLAYYEDLEEQGRLIILQLTSGDKIYRQEYNCSNGMRYNCENENGIMTGCRCNLCYVYPCDLHSETREYEVECVDHIQYKVKDNDMLDTFSNKNIGIDIFLTEEEIK